MYFSVVTAATVGYGDIVPVKSLRQTARCFTGILDPYIYGCSIIKLRKSSKLREKRVILIYVVSLG